MTQNRPAVREVAFDDGNHALLVTAAEDADPAGLLDGLGLAAGRPVIVLVGGAVAVAEDPLAPVCRLPGAALVRAAGMAGAAIVDGTTDADAMAAIGDAYADAAADERAGGGSGAGGAGRGPLLGVAAAGQVLLPRDLPEGRGDRRVRLEPNHSHYALAAGDQWGAAAWLLPRLAAALAGGAPVVMVILGGGPAARAEALEGVRRGWPLFVIDGSGGTADDIAQWWHTTASRPARRPARALAPWRRRGRRDRDADREPQPRDPVQSAAQRGHGLDAAAVIDPDLAKIVERGDLRLVNGALVEDAALARRLAWELQDAPVLKLGWERFARYHAAAARLRRTDDRLQRWPLALGVAAVLVALVQHGVRGRVGANSVTDLVLHWTVAALPFLATVVLLAGHRFGSGRRWPLLRAAAEAARRELYTYRTATGPYAPSDGDAEADGRADTDIGTDTGAAARDATLAGRLGAIDAGLMQTEVAAGSLPAYSGPLPPPWAETAAGDDGLSPLDPHGFLELRLAERLGACRARVAATERRRRRLQLLILAAGVAGTVLAAARLELWVGLSTAVLFAVVAYLAHLQVEAGLLADNRAAARLEAIRARWLALPAAHRDTRHFAVLVEQTEAAADPAHADWSRQLADAIAAAQALAQVAASAGPEASREQDPSDRQGPGGPPPAGGSGNTTGTKRSPAARLTGLFTNGR